VKRECEQNRDWLSPESSGFTRVQKLWFWKPHWPSPKPLHTRRDMSPFVPLQNVYARDTSPQCCYRSRSRFGNPCAFQAACDATALLLHEVRTASQPHLCGAVLRITRVWERVPLSAVHWFSARRNSHTIISGNRSKRPWDMVAGSRYVQRQALDLSLSLLWSVRFKKCQNTFDSLVAPESGRRVLAFYRTILSRHRSP